MINKIYYLEAASQNPVGYQIMIYKFGEYELDTQRLTFSQTGKMLRVRPTVLRVLSYLIEHRDRAVGKQELAKYIWPGQPIHDATLRYDSGRTPCPGR